MEARWFPVVDRTCVTVFTLLAAGLMLAGPAAANTIFVHQSDPTCAGHGTAGVTCFSTIQAGVNNAVAPAQVSVFPGTYVESVNIGTMATLGDLRLTALGGVTVAPTPTGNGIFSSVTPFPGNVIVEGFTVLAPLDGIFLDARDNVTITNVVANGNGSDGLRLFSRNGTVTVHNLSANMNNSDGLFIQAAGDVLVDPSSTSNNQSDGARLFSQNGKATVLSLSASGNQSDGLFIQAAGDVLVDVATANANQSDGARLFSLAGKATVHTVTANENQSDGLFIQASGDVMVDPSTTSGNQSDGSRLFSQSGSIAVQNLTTNMNTSDGLFASAATDATIAAVTATDNQNNGIFAEALNVTIQRSHILRNMVEGIVLLAMGGTTGTFLVSCSDIAGNGLDGLGVNSGITVNAEHNWWGAVTGPTDTNNPGGTGDKIREGPGAVSFSPFLFAPADIASPCSSRAPAPALSPTVLGFVCIALTIAGMWRLRRGAAVRA